MATSLHRRERSRRYQRTRLDPDHPRSSWCHLLRCHHRHRPCLLDRIIEAPFITSSLSKNNEQLT